MVLVAVKATHEPIVRPRRDPNGYDGFMLACTCGWKAMAYDPPDELMHFPTEEHARSTWVNLHRIRGQ